MKFGKLSGISAVDFSLPDDHSGHLRMLENLSGKQSESTIYVGCTGWGMKEWVGTVYPPKTKAGDFLNWYGKQFNTIELNTTHYRTPSLETVRKWRSLVSDDFKFAPKFLQTISHSGGLGIENGNLSHFVNAISELKDRLGCSFIQFPPYFKGEHLGRLARFLGELPTDFQIAVELRHEDWYSNPSLFNQVSQLLEQFNQTFVITDVAGRRDVLHMRLTSEVVMIRFVGNNLVPSDYTRVDDWISRLLSWTSSGIKEIYFFTHEPDNIQAPQLADYFVQALLKRNYEGKIRGPKIPIQPETKQFSLF